MVSAIRDAMSTIADELRQRTFRYALRNLAFCPKLPNTPEGQEIRRQLLRAGMGTSSNYWSACRGRSGAEFVAKLGVAEDEAAESVMWLMMIVQSGMNETMEVTDLLAEGREITAILSKSHKTAKENRRKRKQKRTTEEGKL
jgi:four helix bundle protein